ncbi:MAG: hypothetical protein HQM09_04650 [Candidatus Riflebacteria bacterium]|nr:hypothetical protein [Candidatus Riflebacteria bacterium]
MKMFFSSRAFWFMPFTLLVCAVLATATGCSTAGSAQNTDSGAGPLVATIVPVRIIQDGAVDLDGMYVGASGGGITGGWLADTTGTKIENSELVFQPPKKVYERTVARSKGGFPSGIYTLNSTAGTGTVQLKSRNLNWTTAVAFQTTPRVSWDSNSRYLTVTAATTGSNIRYQLEVWDTDRNSLASLENETASVEVLTYLPMQGRYQIRFWANVYEGGAMISRALYISSDRTF